jgi:hypothetical protein
MSGLASDACPKVPRKTNNVPKSSLLGSLAPMPSVRTHSSTQSGSVLAGAIASAFRATGRQCACFFLDKDGGDQSAQNAILLLLIGELSMTRTIVHRIYKSALLIALCVTFMGAALLFGEVHFKRIVQVAPIPQASSSYGELPMAW